MQEWEAALATRLPSAWYSSSAGFAGKCQLHSENYRFMSMRAIAMSCRSHKHSLREWKTINRMTVL